MGVIDFSDKSYSVEALFLTTLPSLVWIPNDKKKQDFYKILYYKNSTIIYFDPTKYVPEDLHKQLIKKLLFVEYLLL